MPRRYFSFADPTDALRSMRVVELARTRPLATAVRDGDGFTTITVATRDRPGLLSFIAGAMAAHRIDILRADVFVARGGMALDVFVVKGPRGGPVERGRWRAARRDLARLLAGEEKAESLLARRVRPSGLPPRHVPSVKTKVTVDNRSSRNYTIVDVFAEDRRGLLHAITAALHKASLSIVVARIATEGNRAIDSFYVADPRGNKVADPQTLEALRTMLLDVVQP
jgi:[protein-PII] uridylyltransferase